MIKVIVPSFLAKESEKDNGLNFLSLNCYARTINNVKRYVIEIYRRIKIIRIIVIFQFFLLILCVLAIFQKKVICFVDPISF